MDDFMQVMNALVARLESGEYKPVVRANNDTQFAQLVR